MPETFRSKYVGKYGETGPPADKTEEESLTFGKIYM